MKKNAKKNRTYLASEIDEKYKSWERGDIIIIKAQTGRGKTKFILNELLKYASCLDRKILYLVNRDILKGQIEDDLLQVEPELRMHVRIETYQTLENCYKNLKSDFSTQGFFNEHYMEGFFGYYYIVADECHYFSTDSLFNQNTELSYQWISSCFDSVVIYMSATMDYVEPRIIEDYNNKGESRTFYYEIKYGTGQYLIGPYYKVFEKKGFNKRDAITRKHSDALIPYGNGIYDYSYINPSVIYDDNSLVDLVKNEKTGKWLVFINDIERCKRIESALIKNGIKSICIDSDYDKQEDTMREVENIRQKSQFTAQVLITTSVMDNGVTIKDKELKNIVISTDTNDSLLQMLGRKREDGLTVNLYLMPMLVDNIKKRKNNYFKILKLIREYETDYRNFDALLKNETYDNYASSVPWTYDKNMMTFMQSNNVPIEIGYENTLYLNCYKELRFVHHQSSLVIKTSWDWRWNYIRKVFYSVGNNVLLNRFAVDRVHKLYNIYLELEEKNAEKTNSEMDEYLITRQLKLFVNDDERIKSIILNAREGRLVVYIYKVDAILNNLVGKKIKVTKDSGNKTITDNGFKQFLLDEDWSAIRILAQIKGNKTYANMALKKEPLSRNFIKWLNEECNLPYKQTVNKGVYELERLK